MTEQTEHEEKAEADEKASAPPQPVQCGLPRTSCGEAAAVCTPATPARDDTQEDA